MTHSKNECRSFRSTGNHSSLFRFIKNEHRPPFFVDLIFLLLNMTKIFRCSGRLPRVGEIVECELTISDPCVMLFSHQTDPFRLSLSLSDDEIERSKSGVEQRFLVDTGCCSS